MSTHQTPQILKRILITLSLGLAFIVMASIFSPDRSRASGDGLAPRRSHHNQRNESANAESTNAHKGLNSLGVIESGRYDIAVYATDAGPRYTIVARDRGEDIGTLLTAEQVQLLLPEIDLKTLDFSASEGKAEQLMLADPNE